MGLILDTNFVIAIERETRRGLPGNAGRFFSTQLDEDPVITFTIAGELACGRSMSERHRWQQLIAPYQVLPWTGEIAWQYGELYRHLQARGRLIGTNDLWIAATALVHGMELVTNNTGEFLRVPGLRVLAF